VVLVLAAFGVEPEFIASVLAMDTAVLRKRFEHELELGRINLHYNINLELHRAAAGEGRGPSIKALLYLCRRYHRLARAENEVDRS
jgi:hypothetical protein